MIRIDMSLSLCGDIYLQNLLKWAGSLIELAQFQTVPDAKVMLNGMSSSSKFLNNRLLTSSFSFLKR